MLLTCNYCLKKFEKSKMANNKTKFCSNSCCLKNYRKTEKHKEYLLRNRDKLNEQNRIRYNKSPLKYRETRKKYAKTEKMKEKYKENYYKNKEIILIRKKDRDNIKKDKCQICNSKEELEIHHFCYFPNKNCVLCKFCHLAQHNKRSLKFY